MTSPIPDQVLNFLSLWDEGRYVVSIGSTPPLSASASRQDLARELIAAREALRGFLRRPVPYCRNCDPDFVAARACLPDPTP